ncbi:APA family basic amino acid/polyamine antiporter [Caulobacter ginsengisoli]|uniref:APA family basic amino acid/polyamine antiporter n=1 Tax=Caulobacter ginsengisoli TaxID=400775 RepID=A0ABU0IPG8_9CAUL|nr:amino acid permease [Caulobacter ginsengisoli]MDQ0463320.1 APA family basic amino acid/polyamine antiporter [Caulobacter ginsengisoli]
MATGIGRIFQRKSVEQIQSEHEHGELKRSLGALNLVLLGIGCIIGTGIFVLTGRAAAQFAGPGIMISFVITGLLCAFVALCYAELASALPVSGSAYSYTYASMGEGAAWVMGLLLLLEYGLAASTVAVGWSGYFASLLADMHLGIPPELTAAPGVAVKDAAGVVIAHGVMNLPAIVVIAAVTMLLIRGVTESATVNNIIVAIKLTVVIAFIVIGMKYVNTAHWTPLVPAQIPAEPAGTNMDIWHQIWRALVAVVTGDNSTKYGIGGVIHGAAVIFFAYLGFEAVSTAGAESRNPGKDMPIGILGALVICTALYIATSAVLVGIVPYASLDNPAPIALAVNQIGLPWFAVLVKIGAIAGLSSVMLVLLYGQTRIFYTMSKDGLLPKSLAVVHNTYKTPWINTIIVGIAAMAAAGFLSLDALADLSNVGSLAAFTLVCITVIYLRISDPKLARPFRTPLYPFTPIMGAVMCLVLLLALMATPATRNFFLIYLGGGIVLYFAYGIWNSKLGRGVIVEGHEAAPMELPHKPE